MTLSIGFVFAENEIEDSSNTSSLENTTSGGTTTNPITETENSSTNSSETETKQEENLQETNTQKNQVTTPTVETPKTTETPTKAQEETNSTNNKKTTNKTNNATQTTTKSSNANLSNLGINPNDFSGFLASKTSYSVTVPNNVKLVEVYATAKDSSANISGIGSMELKEGQNTANVVVTAEDGTTKTYTITITRLKAGETIEKQKNIDGIALKDLKIEDANLEPSLEDGKYTYTASFEGEQTSLKFKAEASQSSNIVQIIGNENLVDGENNVLIIVSDSDEENSVVYQITVKKNPEKLKAIQKEAEDKERFKIIKKWAIRILFFVVIFGIMAFIIIRHRRSQWEDEYEENEVPKSLKKNTDRNRNTNNNKNGKKNKGKHGK